jgi:putative ABC transport system ATP-binding protein
MILELRNIFKTYQQGKLDVPVLKDISLSVEQGEYLAIMGPSGSGKTTLMNIIGCLDTPTSGEYLLEDEPVDLSSDTKMSDVRLRSIGFVFQSFYLLSQQSALENVALPLLYAGVKRKERLEIAQKALERVGLGERTNFKPTQLSGGQCQRVAIARAIVNNPKILLADEPTGALDTKSGQQIMEIFQKLNDEGVTIVMITHEPDIAKQAKRILHIRDGQLTDEKGNVITAQPETDPTLLSPAELFDRPENPVQTSETSAEQVETEEISEEKIAEQQPVEETATAEQETTELPVQPLPEIEAGFGKHAKKGLFSFFKKKKKEIPAAQMELPVPYPEEIPAPEAAQENIPAPAAEEAPAPYQKLYPTGEIPQVEAAPAPVEMDLSAIPFEGEPAPAAEEAPAPYQKLYPTGEIPQVEAAPAPVEMDLSAIPFEGEPAPAAKETPAPYQKLYPTGEIPQVELTPHTVEIDLSAIPFEGESAPAAEEAPAPYQKLYPTGEIPQVELTPHTVEIDLSAIPFEGESAPAAEEAPVPYQKLYPTGEIPQVDVAPTPVEMDLSAIPFEGEGSREPSVNSVEIDLSAIPFEGEEPPQTSVNSVEIDLSAIPFEGEEPVVPTFEQMTFSQLGDTDTQSTASQGNAPWPGKGDKP